MYKAPLDVQLSDLQNTNPDFLTLSACDNEHYKYLCPETVSDVPRSLQGECSGSGK